MYNEEWLGSLCALGFCSRTQNKETERAETVKKWLVPSKIAPPGAPRTCEVIPF